MQQYANVILTACAVFPIVAAIFTLPYIIVQFSRYGAVLTLRTLVVYSFILYMLCAYFMVIMPLPARDSVVAVQSSVQLMPFKFVPDFINQSGLAEGDLLGAFTSMSFLTVIFNILLLLPLGIYIRYYFEGKWWQVLVAGFCVSLFFELTQLTGLYGIYPAPYRLFDVDDLITNTGGAMLGYLTAPLFWKFMPTREKMDELSYRRGLRVSFARRFVGTVLDWMTLGIVMTTATMLSGNIDSINIGGIKIDIMAVIYLISVFIVFVLIPTLTRGYTIGKMIVRIRLERISGERVNFWDCLVRYGLLYCVILPLPLAGILFIESYTEKGGVFYVVGAVVCFVATLLFATEVFISAITRKTQLIYGRMSRTINVSTVKLPDEVIHEIEREENSSIEEIIEENKEE